jgi:hypothetical protein
MSSMLRIAALLLGAVHSVTSAPVELDKRGTYLPFYELAIHTLYERPTNSIQMSAPMSSTNSSSSPNTPLQPTV